MARDHGQPAKTATTFVTVCMYSYNSITSYNFEVTVRDHGQPAKTATTFVTVCMYSYNKL